MPRSPLHLHDVTWDWSRPYLLGVLNVTPDSFSDGGRYVGVDAAVDRAAAMVADGADALDVGGESTRPGAPPVGESEELARVVPVVEALARRFERPVSIDTTKAAVARAALAAGASLLNDVGTGDAPEALGAAAAEYHAVYVAMHARGTPATMGSLARYTDVVAEVCSELGALVERLVAAGVERGRVILDPGLGFAKTGAHSLALLADLAALRALGYPVCVGPSRKSFIVSDDAHPAGWARDDAGADARLGGTAAAVTAAVLQGAEVLRVHDVAAMRQAARVAHALALRGAGGGHAR
ncbi:MAG: dihydropteroate synthase [Deltaproteobacteria bacterium]|nr:dihydropteroate synthase [Myxococcales bacterium]MDP3216302.1 dihydropteroate synthase [Deltaproteobacteria bacterium]